MLGNYLDIMMKYLMNDLICFRATSPAALVKLQDKFWDPYIQFMKDSEFKLEMNTCSTWDATDVITDQAGLQRVRSWLESLDPWKLVVIDTVSGTCVFHINLYFLFM